MPEPLVRLERDGAVARLTLDRPRAYNAIDEALARELLDRCLEVEADDGVRCVVLRGAGERAFCAGGDVPSFAAAGQGAPALLRRITAALHTALVVLARMPKPTIAALNGVVAGGGVGLALVADLAVAAEHATFTLAYPGIGATPDAGATWFLPRLVGARRAAELVLLNQPLPAASALAWGMVNRVVPAAELDATVAELARTLAAGPTAAHGAARRLLGASFERSLEAQLEAEASGIAAAGRTADFGEGVRAFVEKRKPAFTGR